MGGMRAPIVLTVMCVGLATLAAPASAGPEAAADCATAPWMDRRKTPDERGALVVAEMTIDEKVQETASMLDATHSRETPPIERLCVPALRLNNGSAGVSTGGPIQSPATALPAPIGLAATWDADLAPRYRVVEGVETIKQGRKPLEGPVIHLR